MRDAVGAETGEEDTGAPRPVRERVGFGAVFTPGATGRWVAGRGAGEAGPWAAEAARCTGAGAPGGTAGVAPGAGRAAGADVAGPGVVDAELRTGAGAPEWAPGAGVTGLRGADTARCTGYGAAGEPTGGAVGEADRPVPVPVSPIGGAGRAAAGFAPGVDGLASERCTGRCPSARTASVLRSPETGAAGDAGLTGAGAGVGSGAGSGGGTGAVAGVGPGRPVSGVRRWTTAFEAGGPPPVTGLLGTPGARLARGGFSGWADAARDASTGRPRPRGASCRTGLGPGGVGPAGGGVAPDRGLSGEEGLALSATAR
ncbi:hypothetical protein ABT001_05590 [Streptomyces sp. NPDC002793]|uniref:hypothetical protein n=1 Tax=Streptomyces sp. NPDC002793 TaxID=3154432 RepID=UPI0033310C04